MRKRERKRVLLLFEEREKKIMSKETIRRLILISPETFERFLNSIPLPAHITDIEKGLIDIIRDETITASQRLFLLYTIITKNALKSNVNFQSNTKNAEMNTESINLFENTPPRSQPPGITSQGVQTKTILKKNKATDMEHTSDKIEREGQMRSFVNDEEAFPSLSKSFEIEKRRKKQVKSNTTRLNGGTQRVKEDFFTSSPHEKTQEDIEQQQQQQQRSVYEINGDDDDLNVFTNSNPGPDIESEAASFLKNLQEQTQEKEIDLRKYEFRNLDNPNVSWVDVMARDGSMQTIVKKPSAFIKSPAPQLSPQKNRSGALRQPINYNLAWRGYSTQRFNDFITDSYKKKRRKKNINSTE